MDCGHPAEFLYTRRAAVGGQPDEWGCNLCDWLASDQGREWLEREQQRYLVKTIAAAIREGEK